MHFLSTCIVAVFAWPCHALQGHRIRHVLEGCEGIDCLMRYVSMPDPTCSWKDTGYRFDGLGFAVRILNVTSQSWEPSPDSGRFVWWHPLVVIIPTNLDLFHAADFGIVYIGGTLVQNSALHDPAAVMAEQEVNNGIQLAVRSRAVVAVLLQLPNQALVFQDDPMQASRSEDAIKAYSWRRFMDDPSHPLWPVEVPSTKAVVRAMDVLTEFSKSAASPLPAGTSIERFGLIGLSKRGMAAYTTAAVDARVKAIVPVSISLDTNSVIHKLHQMLGNLPVALYDYVEEKIFDDTPALARLYKLIDPIHYIENLTVPKLLIFAGNDDFFPVDSSREWYSTMPGHNSLRIVPNSRHLVPGVDFLPSANCFFRSFILGVEAPRITWTIDDDNGTVHMQQLSNHTPLTIRAWRAFTGDQVRRDFRWNLYSPGATMWSASEAEVHGPGAWSASVGPLPSGSGWGAVMLEVEYQGPDINGPTWRLTSEAVVSPKTYPFPDCHAAACQGTVPLA